MRFRLILFVATVLLAGSQPISSMAQGASRSVRDIQQALFEKGYGPGTVDGVWGKKSIAALRSFQQSRGLPVTGVVDERVTRELFPTPPSPAPVVPKADNSPRPAAVPQAQSTPPTIEDKRPALTTNTQEPSAAPTSRAAPVSVDSSPKPATTSGGGGLAVGVVVLGLGLLAFAYRKRKKRSQLQTQIVDEAEYQSLKPIPKSAVDSVIIPKMLLASPEPPFRQSLTAHNAAVLEFVRTNNLAATNDEVSVDVRDTNQLEIGQDLATSPQLQSTVTTEDAKQLAQAGRPLFGSFRRAPKNVQAVSNNHSGWVPAGSTMTVGGITITGGMVYAGTKLSKQGASYENENCLINPKLSVSQAGDPHGSTMGYWPSYSQITGEARRSYLEWLAGSRSDPGAYIGYVFLYFYGIERRLMLEDNVPDAAEVLGEVRRLVDIYGFNNSFSRYAHELLSAYELKAKPQDVDAIPDVEGNGFEVPNSIKMALGLRVRDGKPIEPKLLLRYARTHPETRVRTPARRAPELLEAMFVDQVSTLHPTGIRVGGGRFKTLKSTYRSCSGSFTVDVAALDGSVPDITDRAEPIGTARTIFERCSDELDEYSRALGRSPGLKTTLSAVSKLPPVLRVKAVDTIPGKPLDRIFNLASNQQAVSVRNLAEIVDVDLGTSVGKSKLRELSQLLSAFGYGNTADPAYALRQAGADDQVVVFKSERAVGEIPIPSEAYRSVQLSVMLGMVVGHADGSFDRTEKQAVIARIEASHNLSADERVRLSAEVRLTEDDPTRLNEWSKRLKDVSPSVRGALAAELVAIAGADGTVHAAEVKALEGLFKRMGLDQQSLYTLLHEGGSTRKDDEPSFAIEAPEGPIGLAIPPEPRKPSGTRIDLSRLHAIRNETRATASVLADIFVEEAEVVELTPVLEEVIPVGDEMFDGLQQRYHSLVTELRMQETWTVSDFDSLIRTAGLMPGAARDALNEWAMDRFDELFIEGDGPFVINSYLLPPIMPNPTPEQNVESAFA